MSAACSGCEVGAERLSLDERDHDLALTSKPHFQQVSLEFVELVLARAGRSDDRVDALVELASCAAWSGRIAGSTRNAGGRSGPDWSSAFQSASSRAAGAVLGIDQLSTAAAQNNAESLPASERAFVEAESDVPRQRGVRRRGRPADPVPPPDPVAVLRHHSGLAVAMLVIDFDVRSVRSSPRCRCSTPRGTGRRRFRAAAQTRERCPAGLMLPSGLTDSHTFEFRLLPRRSGARLSQRCQQPRAGARMQVRRNVPWAISSGRSRPSPYPSVASRSSSACRAGRRTTPTPCLSFASSLDAWSRRTRTAANTRCPTSCKAKSGSASKMKR